MDLPASVPGIAMKKPINNFTHLKTGQQLSQGRQVKCSTFFVVLGKLLACFLSHLPHYSDKFLYPQLTVTAVAQHTDAKEGRKIHCL